MFPLAPSRVAELIAGPGLHPQDVIVNWPIIEAAFADLGMTGNELCVAAIATTRVECPPFKPIHEYGDDRYFVQHYLGKDGNATPEDAIKYAGRGFLQLTGRDNYLRFGHMLGIDLINNPDTALEPNAAASLMAAYFFEHKIAQRAAQRDWAGVRRAVNGGLNGFGLFMRYINNIEGALNA